jgi:soluble lytic murein transglycosylase-like protein
VKRRRLAVALGAALILVIAVLVTLLSRERVQRRRVFHPAGGEESAAAPVRAVPPIAQWTETFASLAPADLAALLEQIEATQPEAYRRYSLAYLHARALVDLEEKEEAAKKLAPFLAKGHPFRNLALHHRAAIADGAQASNVRNQLIAEFPHSIYRDEDIDDELAYLASLGDPKPLIAFAQRISPSATTERRREMSARIVEALAEEEQLDTALVRGLALLRGGTVDDAADRVARALDVAEVHARLNAEQLAQFGETFQTHRQYGRAVALLQLALAKTPAGPRRDELQFALGRSEFGAERFAEAQNIYSRGAREAATPEMKATFFWHAARAAQLRGDDKTAEQLMTSAIAVKGNFPSTLAAITQRLRTRMRQGRASDAQADYTLIRRVAANDRALVEASLAYAVGELARNRAKETVSMLASVPRNRLDGYDRAEFAYWSARALESSDSAASFRAYLDVLRASVPAHFAYFARARLDAPAMAPKLARELAVREAQVKSLIASKKFELAKNVQTDRVLLSSNDHERQLRILASIYRELPVYRTVMELEPRALPRFPDVDPKDPDALLMAMGLFDEAAIQKRYGLAPASEALTRAYALYRGGASRESIYAMEVMMNRVPRDFHPELLPKVVRRLLYPRYFYAYIAEDAEKYESDPTLLLSIMREESRFNPRAKSQAAARGLLQFIITTARDIGRDVGLMELDPEDLYDPRIIIRLGAKYISELAAQFSGNRYRIAAAYNAGPKQVALWNRMQPAAGDDYFLTAVNFDETKHYVRKVMNSYERYAEIYGSAGPKGGLRAEP